MMQPDRRRLPNRRPSISETIEIGGQVYTATAGFDLDELSVKEVFLSGAKEGSTMDAILGDAAVVISVALQHGVPIEALAKSVARIRTAPLRPEDLDTAYQNETVPATAIGATLDFLRDVLAEAKPAVTASEQGT
ncbi:MAG: hypothetical protein HQL36_02890 [Alphaproteobacteria bacterium]|nr:hypothetical protein [Alphaproteobacteria bacterium]